MPRFNPIILCCLLVFPIVASAAEKTFVIHFDDPDRKGDHAVFERVTATVITDSTKWADVDDTEEHEFASGHRLLGEWRVLDTDDHDNSTSESMVVRSWTGKTELDGKAQPQKDILPAGAKVVVKADPDGGEPQYTVDDEAPPDEVASLLPSVLFLERIQVHTRDSAIFGGGGKPRKVGDSWPIDADAASKMFRDLNVIVAPQDISGTVKFVGVETYNGKECVRVATDMKLASIAPSTQRAQQRPGKFVNDSMSSYMEVLIDAKGTEKQYALYSMDRRIEKEGTRAGRKFRLTQTSRQEIRARRLPDEAAPTTTSATTKP